jgi:hypothetical protein
MCKCFRQSYILNQKCLALIFFDFVFYLNIFGHSVVIDLWLRLIRLERYGLYTWDLIACLDLKSWLQQGGEGIKVWLSFS